MSSHKNEPGSVHQKPLFGCTNCYEEYSFPAFDLRVHDGQCWCDDCWQVRVDDGDTDVLWSDLPGFVPITDRVKSSVVQDFVNTMIGAFETGFVDSNTLTLATIYQVMRNHCKDEFGVEVPTLDVAWGENTARECDIKPASAAVPDFLLEMSRQMQEQPNRCTAHPFWQVRCKSYLPAPEGYNEHHFEVVGDEGVIWRSIDPIDGLVSFLTEEHADWCQEWFQNGDYEGYESIAEAMESCFKPEDGEFPEGLTWLAVQEIEEVVTTHLTQTDAEWFIARKQHDYPKLYTYVESAYWSPQLKKLQDWIISLTADAQGAEQK